MMEVHEENDHSSYVLRSYELGQFIKVNNQQYQRPIILSAMQLNDEWRPQTPGDIQEQDWQAIITLKPEILLIGTGEQQHRLSNQQLSPIIEQKIGVECMDTGAACRTYTALVAEGRAVVAALFIHS